MEGPDNNIIQVLHNIVNEYGISNVEERNLQPVVPPGSTMDELATKVLALCQRGDGEHLMEGMNGPLYAVGMNMARPQIQCQVEGCPVDLMRLKDYHQRYRICSDHLKCDFIVRDGQKMRFCQQCGKFQSLESFDREKRSCRERLRRHNERRRKRVVPDGHVATRSMEENNRFIACDQDLGTIADLLSYMGACRDMDEAHIAAIMEGKNPSSLRTDQDAISSAKVISMILNKNMDSISPRPLVPNLATMQFLLRQFARMFHYQLRGIQLTPCPDAMKHYDAVDKDETNNKRLKAPNYYDGMELRNMNKSEEVFDGEHAS